MSTIIKLEKVTKWYGQVIGLNEVTLHLHRGVTGLLGPNGAGKSTLMKILSGQIRASMGKASMMDEPVWNNPGLRARVGFCPELDAFYEGMTGHGFVAYLMRLQGFDGPQASARALQALEQVSLLSAKDKRIGAYSHGMRQRVKLAQALAHDPEVLLLDEPLTGMDPVGRMEIIALVKQLGAEGRTVVVSSHVLHEVEAMTREIVLIHRGRILAEGDVHHIRDLIDDHPHNVRILTPAPRELAELLIGFEDVLSIRFEGDGKGLVVETHEPEAFYQRLPQLVLDRAIKVDELYSPDDNLESVFKFLVK